MNNKSKGIPMTKCSICGKPGWKFKMSVQDRYNRKWYYKHLNSPVKPVERYKTCYDNRTVYESFQETNDNLKNRNRFGYK